MHSGRIETGGGGGHQNLGTVLVVEDDDDTRAALADALADLGHAIEVESDGESALARLKASTFDAVLTDIRMPKMDGLELCRRLSGDRPDLPVLVITAFGDVESALGALRAGACDFITKPVKLESLGRALERALSRSRRSPFVVRPVPAATHEGAELNGNDQVSDPRSMDEVERRHVLRVLDALGWNKAEAARVLGINRATLYRKLQRYGLEGNSNSN